MKSASSFIHLHTHSEHSLLWGTAGIKDLVRQAKDLGMPALALTDTNRMGGLIVFVKECRNAGIKPILGTELTLETEHRQPGGSERPKTDGMKQSGDGKVMHTDSVPLGQAGRGNPNSSQIHQEKLVLLAKNREGYADLCTLITRKQLAHGESQEKPFSLIDTFQTDFPNLFFIMASPGLLHELADTPNRARLYAECIDHGPNSRRRNRELMVLAEALKLDCVATNDIAFLKPEDWHTHKILRAIKNNTTLSRLAPEEHASPKAYFRTPDEMHQLFEEHPHWLRNTRSIAEQCVDDLDLSSRWILPRIQLPRKESPEKRLRKLAFRGLGKNYGGSPKYVAARNIQEKELKVINNLGYASYFLMVKKIRDAANRRLAEGFRRPKDCTLVRGSAANSITFYNIGASDLDPIRYNLYFERFLNEERSAPPDADMDFGWDERDDVFDFFTEAWGRERVAVVGTTNRFKGRSAIRETAKVFGWSEGQITELLDKPGALSRNASNDAGLQRVLHYANKIKGLPHFMGQHCGGILVTNDPICRHVACEFSGGGKNRVITQVDMHSGLDELGLIKFDILGNGSLSVLRDTLEQIREQGYEDPEVHLDEKMQKNEKVWDLIRRGETRGIFYIESPAQIRLNVKAGTVTFEEIGITSSLVRPAGTAYTKVFVERHRQAKRPPTPSKAPARLSAMPTPQAGTEAGGWQTGLHVVGGQEPRQTRNPQRDWEFLHTSLEDILKETHDVIAFQEDVIKICHEIAGMPLHRADRVRKMMNSLHEGAPEDYTEVEREFLEGCRRNKGFTPAQAKELWKRINSFQGFSFCKSHSLSYAQLSFKCAYLKCHYPAQFMAAVISNNHGYYSHPVYIQEARRWGVRLKPIHVNHSRIKYVGTDAGLIPGFMHIRGLRQTSMEHILNERERGGLFESFEDFLQRTALPPAQMEALIKVGALDGFEYNQPQMLYRIRHTPDRNYIAQRDIFKQGDGFSLPLFKDYTLTQKCLNEWEHLHYILSADMLDLLQCHPSAQKAVPCGHLKKYHSFKGTERVSVCGWSITFRLHHVPGKGEMKFTTLQDASGYADVVFWPDVYRRIGHLMYQEGALLIRGRVREDWGTYALIAESVEVLRWSPNRIDFQRTSEKLAKSLDKYKHFENRHVRSAA